LSLFYYSLTAKNLKKFYPVFFIVLAVCIVYYGQIYYTHGLPEFISKGIRIENFISDVGGKTGFSIFSLILGFIGFVYLRKKKGSFIILTITLLAASFYFGKYINLYFNFIIAFFAGSGFFILLKRRWASDILKKFSIILLICGLVFSPIAYTKELSTSLPDQSTISSLEWLKENSDEQDILFSDYSKGFWIEYFAKRPVVMDGWFTYAPKLSERIKDSRDIFYSYKLEETKSLLDKYSIKYIWIDPAMKQQIWEDKRTGLLFLFRNCETFRNVYDKEGIEIWEYLKKGNALFIT